MMLRQIVSLFSAAKKNAHTDMGTVSPEGCWPQYSSNGLMLKPEK